MKRTLAILVMIMMAVGFEWSLPQRSGDLVKITIKNQFSVTVGFYIDDGLACEAAANSSCTVRINIGRAPFKIEARNSDKKVIASHTFSTLAPGKDIVWATGNVELNPRPIPVSPQAVAPQAVKDLAVSPPTAPKGTDISFVMSVTTLNYQGQKDQFLAKRTSLAKIERQKTLSGATYTFSGEGGMRIGRNGEPAFYNTSPITVNRSLPGDTLSCDKGGLNAWFAVLNSTMNGLAQKGKHIRSGAWEDSVVFPEGEGLPKTVRAQFWARPLPKPDDRWILITVDSGLIFFEALDQKYKDFDVQGRYRGILVYSPDEDTFLESAAALTLYHGEDRFRVEQIQYAADAEGKQLLPVPDLGDYLDFTPKKANPSPQGSLPSWCVQATIVFNLLHMGSMSAAEGATNPGCAANVEQWLLDLIQHDYTAVEKILGRAAADELMGDWMKLIDSWNTGKTLGFGKALWDLGVAHAKDFVLAALPYNMGRQVQILEFTRDVANATMDDIDAGVQTLKGINYQALKYPPPPPAPAVDLTKPKAPEAPKPPDEIKKPGNSLGAGTIIACFVAGGLGAYALNKYVISGSSGSEDCGFWQVLFDAEADKVLFLGGNTLRGNFKSQPECDSYQLSRPQFEQQHSKCVCSESKKMLRR